MDLHRLETKNWRGPVEEDSHMLDTLDLQIEEARMASISDPRRGLVVTCTQQAAPTIAQASSIESESSEELEPAAGDDELPSGEEVEIDDADMPFPFRARGKGKLHLQHFICATGVVPYCRDTPFALMLQEDAQLLQTPGQWSEICQRCIYGLPEAIARKLKRSCDN